MKTRKFLVEVYRFSPTIHIVLLNFPKLRDNFSFIFKWQELTTRKQINNNTQHRFIVLIIKMQYIAYGSRSKVHFFSCSQSCMCVLFHFPLRLSLFLLQFFLFCFCCFSFNSTVWLSGLAGSVQNDTNSMWSHKLQPTQSKIMNLWERVQTGTRVL